jgi:hypothetical protein
MGICNKGGILIDLEKIRLAFIIKQNIKAEKLKTEGRV